MTPVYVSSDIVRIAGTKGESLKDVKAFAVDVATRLQDMIADAFEDEQTFKGELKENTDAYTDSKVAAGLDPRRGHREGTLQDALRSARLWQVVGERIIFSEAKLLSAVEHAEYYAVSKARGGRIVGVKKAWVMAVAAQVRSKKRRVVRGKGRQVKISGTLVNIKPTGLGSEVKIGA